MRRWAPPPGLLFLLAVYSKIWCYNVFIFLPLPNSCWLCLSINTCSVLLLLLSQFFWPLLGRTKSRDRCWAAIRLSHRPELSGRAVHEEVDGLDIGGQHGRRLILLRHTHRPQRRPYPICTTRNGNARHQFLEGSLRGVPVSGMKMRSLLGLYVHSAFHWWPAHFAARMLLLSCAAGREDLRIGQLRPWPRAPRFWAPRATRSYDGSLLT